MRQLKLLVVVVLLHMGMPVQATFMYIKNATYCNGIDCANSDVTRRIIILCRSYPENKDGNGKIKSEVTFEVSNEALEMKSNSLLDEILGNKKLLRRLRVSFCCSAEVINAVNLEQENIRHHEAVKEEGEVITLSCDNPRSSEYNPNRVSDEQAEQERLAEQNRQMEEQERQAEEDRLQRQEAKEARKYILVGNH